MVGQSSIKIKLDKMVNGQFENSATCLCRGNGDWSQVYSFTFTSRLGIIEIFQEHIEPWDISFTKPLPSHIMVVLSGEEKSESLVQASSGSWCLETWQLWTWLRSQISPADKPYLTFSFSTAATSSIRLNSNWFIILQPLSAINLISMHCRNIKWFFRLIA